MLLLQNGEVYTFGSNVYGQLGVGDLVAHSGPVRVKLPSTAVQVAAGSNHTVVLTAKGEVYTFGVYQVSTRLQVEWKKYSRYLKKMFSAIFRKDNWV